MKREALEFSKKRRDCAAILCEGQMETTGNAICEKTFTELLEFMIKRETNICAETPAPAEVRDVKESTPWTDDDF